MSFQFENLTINRLIVHEIFKRDIDREIVTPKCSNLLTVLDVNGSQVLQERIIKSMGNGSHCIEMTVSDDDEGSTFQLCCSSIEGDNENFVEKTKALSLKLAQAQTSRGVPGGILIVFTGTISTNNLGYCAIIKAETHNGFVKEEGDNIISLKLLSELLLTPQQKLYKIGFIIEQNQPVYQDTLRSAEDFIAYVYDHNMSKNETKEAALYFYNTFLGCAISPSSKKLTKDFYHLTKEYINSTNLSAEEKIDLQNSLYSYLKTSQQNTIMVSSFAEEFLPVATRDEYSNHMETKSFPSIAISKDLTHLKTILKRRKIKFTSQIKIEGPAENFETLIEILETTEAYTTVKIKGRIANQG